MMFLLACFMSALDFALFSSMCAMQCDFSNTLDKIYQMHTHTHKQNQQKYAYIRNINQLLHVYSLKTLADL